MTIIIFIIVLNWPKCKYHTELVHTVCCMQKQNDGEKTACTVSCYFWHTCAVEEDRMRRHHGSAAHIRCVPKLFSRRDEQEFLFLSLAISHKCHEISLFCHSSHTVANDQFFISTKQLSFEINKIPSRMGDE